MNIYFKSFFVLGGGLAVLVKEDMASSRWKGLEETAEDKKAGKERMWVLVNTGTLRLAILNIYLACISTRRPEYVMDNERILSLVTKERVNLINMGYTTITLGDMNAKIGGEGCLKEKGNDLRINQNGHLLKQWALQNHMIILNSRPLAQGLFTRKTFCENENITKESLLDYCLIDEGSESMVSSFIIDEYNRFSITSDHSTIVVTLKLEGAKQKVMWRVRNSWCSINDNTDYETFKKLSDETAMDQEVFKTLSSDEKLKVLREGYKDAWLGGNYVKKRGRGGKRNRRADITRSLIPRMKMPIVKLKSEGKETTEEFKALMERLEKTIETEKEDKARRKRLERTEKEEKFIRSDTNGSKFFEFVR